MAISGTETILVVDDEPLVLSLTSAMLSRHGCTVVTAGSGTDAINLFKNWPSSEIHLLLVDLVMPDMTGPEAVRRILELRPGLPVLYFSAYSADESLRPTYARGIPLIPKPFTSLQLVKKIREVLDSPKSESATAE
jgi:CheY-like chemotaxis protein